MSLSTRRITFNDRLISHRLQNEGRNYKVQDGERLDDEAAAEARAGKIQPGATLEGHVDESEDRGARDDRVPETAGRQDAGDEYPHAREDRSGSHEGDPGRPDQEAEPRDYGVRVQSEEGRARARFFVAEYHRNSNPIGCRGERERQAQHGRSEFGTTGERKL